jgi:hypothetical protein
MGLEHISFVAGPGSTGREASCFLPHAHVTESAVHEVSNALGAWPTRTIDLNILACRHNPCHISLLFSTFALGSICKSFSCQTSALWKCKEHREAIPTFQILTTDGDSGYLFSFIITGFAKIRRAVKTWSQKLENLRCFVARKRLAKAL